MGDTLYLFGGPRLERMGEPVQVGRRKSIALLAYLAVTQQGHGRSALASLFWPEMDESRSRTILRRALSDLNRALGRGWSNTHEDRVSLNPDANLWVDVDAFRASFAACRQHGHAPEEACTLCRPALRAAVDLYRDEFLAGFTLPDCPAFDEWQFFVAEELRRDVASALSRLVVCYRRDGDVDAAIATARRLLSQEPWDESAHRTLMALYHESGRQEAALRQYDEVRRVLADEFGVPPSADTTRLYETIAAHRMAPGERVVEPGERAPQRDIARAPARHNLPAPTTAFIGREADLSRLSALLDQEDVRLVTIMAPGGMGKTRLALELARRKLDQFADGVWFAEFATVISPDLIVPAVIRALSLELHGSTDVAQQLHHYMANKSMLLVLDNLEHLPGSNRIVTQLLEAAANLRIVVTSQQRLNLQAETVYPIGGLKSEALPAEDVQASSEAVELFVHTARRVRPDMAFAAADLRQAAWICRAVEGMPLAIILAASWVEVLSLSEIGAEIVRSIDFLRHELDDLPRRQWSIRAVLETAWRRLSQEEQDIFASLSVFYGGFTRETARTVAGAELGMLRSLVSKSLVGRDVEGRFAIHELLRQYAQERLQRSGRYDCAAAVHAQYFLDLAEEGNRALTGPNQAEWLGKLEAERANFESAFKWALSGADVCLGAHLAGALALFWQRRADYLVATTVGERALGLLPEDSAAEQMALHLLLGGIYEPLARYDQSTRHFEAALPIAESLEDSLSVAGARYGLGRIAWRQGRYATAENFAADSLRAAEAAVDKSCMARAFYLLGLIASHQGQFPRAEAYFAQSLEMNEAIGNLVGTAHTLVELGWSASSQGQFDKARAYLARSLQISETSGLRMDMAGSLNTLGWTAEAQGDDAGALASYGQALAIYDAVGLRTGRANTLANVAFVRMRQGDTDAAYPKLRRALTIAYENGDVPVVLEILIGFARHAFQTNRIEECLRLVSLAGAHPALNSQVRRTRLDPLLHDVAQMSSCPAAVEGPAQTERPDFDSIVRHLLHDVPGTE